MATRRAVCLLRSRRRTFLLISYFLLGSTSLNINQVISRVCVLFFLETKNPQQSYRTTNDSNRWDYIVLAKQGFWCSLLGLREVYFLLASTSLNFNQVISCCFFSDQKKNKKKQQDNNRILSAIFPASSAS